MEVHSSEIVEIVKIVGIYGLFLEGRTEAGDNSIPEMCIVYIHIYKTYNGHFLPFFLMVGGFTKKVFAIKLLITSKTSEMKRRRHANCAS